MIRINLLGNRTAIDHSIKLILSGYALALIVMLITCGLLYVSSSSRIKTLTIEKTSLEGEYNNLLKKTASVKELEVKCDTLRKKLTVLARLKNNKLGPIKVLDDLNNSIPEEVWLLRFSESAGSMEITGRAITPQDVANFMDALQKSDYFEVGDLTTKQMYFSKKSKEVSASPFASSSGGGGGKVVAENTIDENNIKIQEFTLATQVFYMGQDFAKKIGENASNNEEQG